ncbi:hypothetical protein ACQ4PT_017457 [Festuca glaucescens]
MGNSQGSSSSASSARFVMASRYHGVERPPRQLLPASPRRNSLASRRDLIAPSRLSQGLLEAGAGRPPRALRVARRAVGDPGPRHLSPRLPRELATPQKFATGIGFGRIWDPVSNRGVLRLAQEYFGVRGALGDRLFQLVAKEGSEEDGVTFEGLIICKATYERGTRDEADEFIFQLCDVMGDGVLTRSDLESVLASLRETIFESNKEAGEGSNKRTSEALLNSAVFSTNAEGVLEKSMSLSDFRNWCIVMPSLRKFLGSLLMPLIQCATNFTSENIPNGIGFGGKPHHFGLFLSAGFDQGHSFTSSTFTGPPLSNTNRFRPEVIECWGIQVKGSLDEKTELVKGTVLERFKEDRNMLKLIGMASASD